MQWNTMKNSNKKIEQNLYVENKHLQKAAKSSSNKLVWTKTT